MSDLTKRAAAWLADLVNSPHLLFLAGGFATAVWFIADTTSTIAVNRNAIAANTATLAEISDLLTSERIANRDLRTQVETLITTINRRADASDWNQAPR